LNKQPGQDIRHIMLLLCLIIFTAAVAYWYVRLRGPSSHDVSSTSKFNAVAIVCDDAVACQAAQALDGKRFLSGGAPSLPLPGCTVEVCTCTFHHHPDRRKGLRRASETGVFEPLFEGGDERQASNARRSTDAAEQPDSKAADAIDPDDSYYDFIAKDS
jgi:hypothetical protein